MNMDQNYFRNRAQTGYKQDHNSVSEIDTTGQVLEDQGNGFTDTAGTGDVQRENRFMRRQRMRQQLALLTSVSGGLTSGQGGLAVKENLAATTSYVPLQNGAVSRVPTSTVGLSSLPSFITEGHIQAELCKMNITARDICIVKDNIADSTGNVTDPTAKQNRALVNFASVADARCWIDQNQGRLIFAGGYTIPMEYSTDASAQGEQHNHAQCDKLSWEHSTSGRSGSEVARKDPTIKDCRSDIDLRGLSNKQAAQSNSNFKNWTCVKCNFVNFQHRVNCRTCGARVPSRDNNPVNTLILRGLSPETNESMIYSALANMTNIDIVNLKVIYDGLSGASLGYAFAELTSVHDAELLLDNIRRLTRFRPLTIDGKVISAGFAVADYSSLMLILTSRSAPPPEWGMSPADDVQESRETVTSINNRVESTSHLEVSNQVSLQASIDTHDRQVGNNANATNPNQAQLFTNQEQLFMQPQQTLQSQSNMLLDPSLKAFQQSQFIAQQNVIDSAPQSVHAPLQNVQLMQGFSYQSIPPPTFFQQGGGNNFQQTNEFNNVLNGTPSNVVQQYSFMQAASNNNGLQQMASNILMQVTPTTVGMNQLPGAVEQCIPVTNMQPMAENSYNFPQQDSSTNVYQHHVQGFQNYWMNNNRQSVTHSELLQSEGTVPVQPQLGSTQNYGSASYEHSVQNFVAGQQSAASSNAVQGFVLNPIPSVSVNNMQPVTQSIPHSVHTRQQISPRNFPQSQQQIQCESTVQSSQENILSQHCFHTRSLQQQDSINVLQQQPQNPNNVQNLLIHGEQQHLLTAGQRDSQPAVSLIPTNNRPQNQFVSPTFETKYILGPTVPFANLPKIFTIIPQNSGKETNSLLGPYEQLQRTDLTKRDASSFTLESARDTLSNQRSSNLSLNFGGAKQQNDYKDLNQSAQDRMSLKNDDSSSSMEPVIRFDWHRSHDVRGHHDKKKDSQRDDTNYNMVTSSQIETKPYQVRSGHEMQENEMKIWQQKVTGEPFRSDVTVAGEYWGQKSMDEVKWDERNDCKKAANQQHLNRQKTNQQQRDLVEQRAWESIGSMQQNWDQINIDGESWEENAADEPNWEENVVPPHNWDHPKIDQHCRGQIPMEQRKWQPTASQRQEWDNKSIDGKSYDEQAINEWGQQQIYERNLQRRELSERSCEKQQIGQHNLTKMPPDERKWQQEQMDDWQWKPKGNGADFIDSTVDRRQQCSNPDDEYALESNLDNSYLRTDASRSACSAFQQKTEFAQQIQNAIPDEQMHLFAEEDYLGYNQGYQKSNRPSLMSNPESMRSNIDRSLMQLSRREFDSNQMTGRLPRRTEKLERLEAEKATDWVNRREAERTAGLGKRKRYNDVDNKMTGDQDGLMVRGEKRSRFGKEICDDGGRVALGASTKRNLTSSDTYGGGKSSSGSNIPAMGADNNSVKRYNFDEDFPDVSKYIYDDSSGLYFDEFTGLYYDEATQYFYDSAIGSFLYWDTEERDFKPVDINDTSKQQDSISARESHEVKASDTFSTAGRNSTNKWSSNQDRLSNRSLRPSSPQRNSPRQRSPERQNRRRSPVQRSTGLRTPENQYRNQRDVEKESQMRHRNFGFRRSPERLPNSEVKGSVTRGRGQYAEREKGDDSGETKRKSGFGASIDCSNERSDRNVVKGAKISRFSPHPQDIVNATTDSQKHQDSEAILITRAKQVAEKLCKLKEDARQSKWDVKLDSGFKAPLAPPGIAEVKKVSTDANTVDHSVTSKSIEADKKVTSPSSQDYKSMPPPSHLSSDRDIMPPPPPKSLKPTATPTHLWNKRPMPTPPRPSPSAASDKKDFMPPPSFPPPKSSPSSQDKQSRFNPPPSASPSSPVTREKQSIPPLKPSPVGQEKRPAPPPMALSHLAAYGDDDADEEEEVDLATAARKAEEELTDWSKLMCLLCKRMFQSKDILTMHQKLSDLHKTNLEEWKRKRSGHVTTVVQVQQQQRAKIEDLKKKHR